MIASTAAAGSIVAILALVAPAFAQESGQPAPAPRTYRVDPQASTAGFTLGATLHTVHGSGGRLSGEFRLRPSGPGEMQLEGEVCVDAASLTTGNNKRDRKMREQTLAVAEHPALCFTPARAAGELPSDMHGEAPVPLRLAGALEIRGVRREVEIDVEARFAEGRLIVDGGFPVGLADYDIPDPSVFVLRVEKTVQAGFHLEAVPGP